MANVWLTVTVLIFTQQVLAIYDSEDDHRTCDECIRAGSAWCSDPKFTQCETQAQRRDDWCTSGPENLKSLPDVSLPRGSKSPTRVERTIKIGNSDYVTIDYNSTKQEVITANVINSTQNGDYVDWKVENDCNSDNQCKANIKVTVDKDFCRRNGTNIEYVDMEIIVGDIMKTLIKFHVPCACECSSKPEKNSFWCHKHGDFVCGVCICQEKWTGKFCNQVKNVGSCKDRGDIPSNDGSFYLDNGLNCSGNGIYDRCDNCICDENRKGAQYFHQESKCGGICQITSNCDGCIRNATVGKCETDCPVNITIQTLNKSLLEDRDIFDRKIWVHCNVTVGDCNVQYMAMSKGDGMFLMVEPCTPATAPLVSEQASLALGIIFLLLVAAVAGGLVVWKYLNRVPPLPSTDMSYHNIDAEDCTGVNPLYIDPCSSFKNPMYGK